MAVHLPGQSLFPCIARECWSLAMAPAVAGDQLRSGDGNQSAIKFVAGEWIRRGKGLLIGRGRGAGLFGRSRPSTRANMFTRKERGSRDHQFQRTLERQDVASHAHLVAAEGDEKQDHPTGHELARQALEHSPNAHEDVAIGARGLWEARGRRDGSSEQDWFQAGHQLQGPGSAVAR
jgi:hypothetical protein